MVNRRNSFQNFTLAMGGGAGSLALLKGLEQDGDRVRHVGVVGHLRTKLDRSFPPARHANSDDLLLIGNAFPVEPRNTCTAFRVPCLESDSRFIRHSTLIVVTVELGRKGNRVLAIGAGSGGVSRCESVRRDAVGIPKLQPHRLGTVFKHPDCQHGKLQPALFPDR